MYTGDSYLKTEDEEEKKLCMQKLRTQIEGVGNFKNILTTNNYLLRFLYSTGFKVDDAFKRITKYHEHMKEYPEIYPTLGPLDIRHIVEKQIITVFPDCDIEGRRIFLYKLGNINTSTMKNIDLAILDEVCLEYILEQKPALAGKGLCYLLDLKNVSYGFIKWFHLSYIKMCSKKVDNMPVKEFVIHILNASFPIVAFSKVVLPLMPESSRKRVKFHYGNWESLHKSVDPKYLPEEYGGTKEINYSNIYQMIYDGHDNIVKSFQSTRLHNMLLD